MAWYLNPNFWTIKNFLFSMLRINREILLPAVHIVKTTWTESKKKNITRRETDAPIGRNRAWVESIVWIPERQKMRHIKPIIIKGTVPMHLHKLIKMKMVLKMTMKCMNHLGLMILSQWDYELLVLSAFTILVESDSYLALAIWMTVCKNQTKPRTLRGSKNSDMSIWVYLWFFAQVW
jgi:hypothetical protein